ncbi:MAG: GTPase, partial [Elusimicrobiota bacterium]
MRSAPKSLRLQIAIFGRTNVGKSSVLNMIAGQDVAITSPVPGTTTDVVEKSMELLPVGPVVFLDTAGLDDSGALGALRTERARRVFDRADVILLVTEPSSWGEWEEGVLEAAAGK